MSDQCDSGQEKRNVREDDDEEKQMEPRVPAMTMSPVGQQVPVTRKKYPVVLPYIIGISEQLRRVFRSFNIPPYFMLTNSLQQLLAWYSPR